MTDRPSDRLSAAGPNGSRVLTVNVGSSSIKFALYQRGDPTMPLLSGKMERIGFADAVMTVVDSKGDRSSRPIRVPTQAVAAVELMQWIGREIGFEHIAAVGHRVVHGGARYSAPERVTREMIDELRRISPFDPEHMPFEIELIEAIGRTRPELLQVACFDTAFHRAMPRVARILPIPRRLDANGVQRYGFHGLSYAFLMEELERVAGVEAARGRVILAHLGNGASMAAVYDGRSMDTSMGFTPTSGLPMSTRSGDLDPGLVWYLARTEAMTAEQFHELVNQRSGLLGVSETSPDMRDLLARQGSDPRAAEAVNLFGYQAKKWIGSFAAVLGGLDTLVFSGGIGENAPEVRGRICEGLEFLGVFIESSRNAASAPVISSDSSRVTVRVIRSNEEVVIAKAAFRELAEQFDDYHQERTARNGKATFS